MSKKFKFPQEDKRFFKLLILIIPWFCGGKLKIGRIYLFENEVDSNKMNKLKPKNVPVD
jgi:hypothetical protein